MLLQSYKTGRTPLFHEYMKVAKLANDSLDKPFLTIDNCRRPENRQKVTSTIQFSKTSFNN